MRGVIYCYTSPSGKKYIGQTVNERHRKNDFTNLNIPYCRKGGKIDNARKKYGPENFIYEVIEEYDLPEKELHEKLNDREIFYIALYNTTKIGYNISKGGSPAKTKEVGDKISESVKN